MKSSAKKTPKAKFKTDDRRLEKWLQKSVSEVLVDDKIIAAPLGEAIRSQIVHSMYLELEDFLQSSGYLIQDIRKFSLWLEQWGYHKFKAARQLDNLFSKYPTADKKKWPSELLQLVFTDSGLLRLYYIYNHLIEKEGEFLDQLIWCKYVPYPEAKEHFGQDLIEDDLNDLSEPMPLKGYRKWCSYLVENYHDDNPYADEHEAADKAFWGASRKHSYWDSHYFDVDYEDFDEQDEDDLDNDDFFRKEALIYEMPDFIQIAFRKVADKPKDYVIQPVEIPDNYLVYEAEAAVFQDLPKILVYLQQGKIKYTKQGALSISSIRQAANKLQLHPLFRGTCYLKILLMGTHLWSKQYNPTTPVLDILRYVLKVQHPTALCLMAALFPIENIRNTNTHAMRPGELTRALELLKLLPEGQWVDLAQIFRYLQLHELSFNPIDDYHLWDLRLAMANPDSEAFMDEGPAEKSQYVQKIFITGVFLTAAVLGLLDLAMDPDPKKIYKLGISSFLETNPWLSFTSCRLTPLGAHFFKGKLDYVPPVSASEMLRFELSPTQLQIRVQGNLDVAYAMLKPWTRTSALHRDLLELDASRIMARCRNKAELIQEIQDFKENIGQPLPDHWQARLMQLIRRSDQVKQVQAAVVFKLSPYDQQLHRIIAQDPTLKKHCFKAEQYMLVVPKAGEDAFIKRLAQLGYVPSFDGSADPALIEFEGRELHEIELSHQFQDLMQQKKQKNR